LWDLRSAERGSRMVCRRMKREDQPVRTLVYRLRESTRYAERQGHLYLVSRFPLKAIILHPSWKKVFDRLSEKRELPFEEILGLATGVNPSRLEAFLNGLVRKGYLDMEGLPLLSEFPPVSIIIPVRNRPDEIAACLNSLKNLEYPQDKLEIIVVDDASEDRTPSVVSQFPARLIALEERHQASFCRNLAAREAKGDILAFIDSDCLADSLWLRELVPTFEDPAVGVVGGLVDSAGRRKNLDRYEKVKSSLRIALWFKRSEVDQKSFYVPSCNMLTRKSLFRGLGGFLAELHVGEDVDYCWRAEDTGYQVEYRPMGRVYHKHRNRLKDFCFRRFDYGMSEPLLQLRHPQRPKKILLSPAASLFWLFGVLGTIAGSPAVAGLCGAVVLADFARRLQKMRSGGVPVGALEVLLAVFRSDVAFLYHLSAFVSRYYLVWAIAVGFFFPRAFMIVLGVHIGVGLAEYFLRKPRVDPLSFLFYFSLDQLFYQLGVWWGCLRNRCFAPVNPQVSVRLASG
jgi:mycofactocin system glycosyltransferase